MSILPTIRKVVEETLERKLAEMLPGETKFPLPLVDHIVLKRKKVRVLVEIYEDSVIAYLAQERDIFAEGLTIRAAKANLRTSVVDEYEFFLRHKKELSRELKTKFQRLQGILE
jgi:hypothetical protein